MPTTTFLFTSGNRGSPSKKAEQDCWRRKAVHLSWQRLKQLCQELPLHVITSTCLTLLVLQLVGGSKSSLSLWIYPIFCEPFSGSTITIALLWQKQIRTLFVISTHTFTPFLWVSTQQKLSGQLQTCHTMSFFHAFSKDVSLLLYNLLEQLCRFCTELGNTPLPCNCYLLGGCLSGNIALTHSLFFSQSLLC